MYQLSTGALHSYSNLPVKGAFSWCIAIYLLQMTSTQAGTKPSFTSQATKQHVNDEQKEQQERTAPPPKKKKFKKMNTKKLKEKTNKQKSDGARHTGKPFLVPCLLTA